MGGSHQIKRLLVANRGEIAVRILKTCQLMELETVVLVTPPDRGSRFSFMADYVHDVSSSAISETYLNAEFLVKLCLQYDCDAVHPGYGFLSESAVFARLCEKNHIKFIGPRSETIELMGDKIKARKAMKALAVPLLEAIVDDDEAQLISQACKLQFPLLVKAAAGGGGRGMRLVERKEELLEKLSAARNEAINAFGDGRLYIERYLRNCRHIEVQVLSDSHGQHLHLLERECSIQRRHQKVIEECPSSQLSVKERNDICNTALKICKAVNYINAGTVEFLWSDGEYYFLEMNTRLQVEHPVTEAVTGVDLVRLQIEIAQGLPLKIKQQDIYPRGHAIEARVYAEDPDNDFLPATGTVLEVGEVHFDHVRVETSFVNGNKVPIEYDSMLAKVSSWDCDRNSARLKLIKSLERLPFYGVKNNRDFLLQVLQNENFTKGQTFTNFIESNDLTTPQKNIPPEIIAASFLIHAESAQESNCHNPWLDS